MAKNTKQQNPFDGLEKRLPENCVEYLLFLVDQSPTDRRKELSKLEDLRKVSLELSKNQANNYIWQREEFGLELKNEQGDAHCLTITQVDMADDIAGLAYLHGVTDYGDSVEDEWLVVFLLRKLSLAHPDLWIRIFDSDGEFLLIEAANVLPAWLNPEMDRNRAWLHQGKLHIIPVNEEGSNKTLSLPDALTLIRSSPKNLVQSDLVDAEAFYRLEKYPEQIANSLHTSIITIPRKLAFVLHEAPKAIAPAVEAFYLRDPIALRPFLASSADLHFPPKDLVTLSVNFTRVLFAQLRSQRFDIPQQWSDIIQKAPDDKARSRLEMGVKLACGFDIMVKRLDKTDTRVAREVGIILEDLQEDGEAALPTDDEIKAWPDSAREDDEAWLDINYEDFERELEGRGRKDKGAKSGFGDATAEADLRKLVSRFESFLNDDSAGVDGAGDDEMDHDDDSGSLDSDDDSEDEDKAVSFDEEAFARMMREMMGLPSMEADVVTAPAAAEGQQPVSAPRAAPPRKGVTIDEDDQGIRDLAAQFEAELNDHGALQLDPTPKKLAALKGKGKEKATTQQPESDEEESTDGEIDIDYNLAKNLLESFKGQAGMAGPAGNMLGMMGMQLPRDEDDGDDDSSKAKK
ncbi:hypothetical protein ACHAQH_001454 [Verticillium albo-atrum]